jgi:hypothetical protein
MEDVNCFQVPRDRACLFWCIILTGNSEGNNSSDRVGIKDDHPKEYITSAKHSISHQAQAP